MIKRALILFTVVVLQVAYADTRDDAPVSIDFQNVNLPEALHYFSQFTHRNVVISSAVRGKTSLYLKNVSAPRALDLLLQTNNLAKQEMGNILFISTRNEVLQNKEEELKWLETLDQAEPLLIHVWQIQYARAEEIMHLVQDNTNSLLSKRGSVHVDARTNILFVQDRPERIQEIDRLIKRLDIPIQQVLIEARLATVDSDYEKELGINFSMQPASGQNNSTTNDTLNGQYSLALARLVDGSLLDVRLAALENEGHGELISTPSLFTANQQPASIEAGEEIPYQEISRSGATGIAFKKAVLSLKVTPQIMPNQQVLLQLQVNQDKPSNRLVLGVPAISTRQMSTHILLKNGQTVVLGGIYESNNEQGQQRIPFLGKIPLVGSLFQQQNVTYRKRELLIFVTPKIIEAKKTNNEKGSTS